MFKSTLTAIVLVVGFTTAAHADAISECRRWADAIWPNPIESFDAEMRAQDFLNCMQQYRRPPTAAPAIDVSKLSDDELVAAIAAGIIPWPPSPRTAPTLRLPIHRTLKACQTYYSTLFHLGMIGVSGQAAGAAIGGCMSGQVWRG